MWNTYVSILFNIGYLFFYIAYEYILFFHIFPFFFFSFKFQKIKKKHLFYEK